MAKKTKTLEVPGAGPVVETAKKDKERFIRATIFPTDGSRPYIRDLEPTEEGLLSLEDTGMEYKIVRGSVWAEDGVMRTIINEDNAQTISAQSFKGDDIMHPKVLHGIAHNNLVSQLNEINQQKSAWRQSSTWIMVVLAVVLILLMVWQVRTMGSGLEELRHAIDGIQVGGSGGGGSGTSEAAQAGHNEIAPGGR